jgi:anti-sigma B factor antagonist
MASLYALRPVGAELVSNCGLLIRLPEHPTGLHLELMAADSTRGADSAVITSNGLLVTAHTGGGGDEALILAEGELDLSTAGELTRLLKDELSRRRTVRLDLSAVSFIDSTGLAAIIAALRSSNDGGGELLMCGELQPQTRRLMELTGVLELLEARYSA